MNSVHDLPSVLWMLTFTLNFYIVNHGQAFLFFIVFLWSISVEEQLYAVWAILLKWFRKLLVPFCFLLIAASIAFRVIYIHDSDNLYFNTLNWAPHFAIGALIAYLAINGGNLLDKLKKLPKGLIAGVYILFVFNLMFYNRIYAFEGMTVIQRLVDTLFFAFFIFEQNFCDNRLFSMGNWKILNYFGKISYGLFCYHGLVILLFTKAIGQTGLLNNELMVFFINPVLIFVITLLISGLSYKYFEKPIMSLRNRFKTA
jgi:peptidoglycan/LPS O-acetylase OafA/YrhL